MAEQDHDTERPSEERDASEAEASPGWQGFVPEMLRRAFYTSLGAVASSEESIRKLANDFKLPRDVANYLINQAQGSRDEMVRIMGNEVRRFLESLDLHDELQRLLTSLSFEIKTEIRFIPNDAQPPRPKITQKIKVKRQKRARGSDDSAEENGGRGEDEQ